MAISQRPNPCPYCGATDDVDVCMQDDRYYQVRCWRCGMRGPHAFEWSTGKESDRKLSKQAAIRAWNSIPKKQNA